MGHAVATTEPTKEGVVRCDACPVLCRIRPGKAGACDRYANVEGVLTRVDPLVITEKAAAKGEGVIPFLSGSEGWNGSVAAPPPEAIRPASFVTGVGDRKSTRLNSSH